MLIKRQMRYSPRWHSPLTADKARDVRKTTLGRTVESLCHKVSNSFDIKCLFCCNLRWTVLTLSNDDCALQFLETITILVIVPNLEIWIENGQSLLLFESISYCYLHAIISNEILIISAVALKSTRRTMHYLAPSASYLKLNKVYILMLFRTSMMIDDFAGLCYHSMT